MIGVTPTQLDSATQLDSDRWLRSSLRVYLEGEKNFHWISRVVHGSEKKTAMVLLTTFGRFNRTSRYRKLLKSLKNSAKTSPSPTVWVVHSSPS